MIRETKGKRAIKAIRVTAGCKGFRVQKAIREYKVQKVLMERAATHISRMRTVWME